MKAGQRIYEFPVGQQTGEPMRTAKVLSLKFGECKGDFAMNLVSDGIPSQSEVDYYVTAQQRAGFDVLSKQRATLLRSKLDTVYAISQCNKKTMASLKSTWQQLSEEQGRRMVAGDLVRQQEIAAQKRDLQTAMQQISDLNSVVVSNHRSARYESSTSGFGPGGNTGA